MLYSHRVAALGKLRMETLQQGGMRWSERSEGSELAVSEAETEERTER